MTGCSDDSSPLEQPTSAPPSPPRTATPSLAPLRTVAPAGTGGMTIRYLDSDGKIKTVRVEDFPAEQVSGTVRRPPCEVTVTPVN